VQEDTKYKYIIIIIIIIIIINGTTALIGPWPPVREVRDG
jgi:hypothetical protein